MPEPKVREVLARVARELQDEETAAEFEELKQRKPTWDDLMQLVKDAPPEARAELRSILAEEGVTVVPPKSNGKGKAKEPPPDEPDEPDEPKPPARRKRPGRKSGSAYDWYVDDDGNVVRSPVAVIYSGEDEPDEVEMLDEPDEPEGGDDE